MSRQKIIWRLRKVMAATVRRCAVALREPESSESITATDQNRNGGTQQGQEQGGAQEEPHGRCGDARGHDQSAQASPRHVRGPSVLRLALGCPVSLLNSAHFPVVSFSLFPSRCSPLSLALSGRCCFF